MKIRPFKRNRQYRPSLSVFHRPPHILPHHSNVRAGPAASSLTSTPLSRSFGNDVARVALSLWTQNRMISACSERKAQIELILQPVSSACTTAELARSVQSASNSGSH